MKTFFTSLALFAGSFLLLTTGSDAHAQDISEKSTSAFYSDFYVMQVRPMKFKLAYNWPLTDRISVKIMDDKRTLLFTETVLVYKKYEKLFDMSIFADGVYIFELYDGEKKFSHSFDITTKTTRIAVNNSGQKTEILEN